MIPNDLDKHPTVPGVVWYADTDRYAPGFIPIEERQPGRINEFFEKNPEIKAAIDGYPADTGQRAICAAEWKQSAKLAGVDFEA